MHHQIKRKLTIKNLKKMKTYKIVGETNGYIASRDFAFNGKPEIVLEEGLTLKDANRKLLEMFNDDYDTELGSRLPNWGLVIAQDWPATHHQDGTYSYEYDSRYYSVEEEE